MSFIQYLENQNLHPKTVQIHVRNLAKYGAVGTSQKIMQNKLDLNETWSKRLSQANTISKYLKYKQQPNEQIVKYIHEANEAIQIESANRRKDMAEDPCLPTLKEMWEYTNSLYASGEYKSYCIMYLFLMYNVRNQELIAKVVKSKKQANETDNFFIVGKNRVTWIRNKYKTVSKYGTKIHIIKNKKFHTAISKLDYLLREDQNIDRVIKKITADIGGVTESTIVKIVLRENNSMNGISRVSKNRGTDISTLIHSYNIT
jgi:hypothetical protein